MKRSHRGSLFFSGLVSVALIAACLLALGGAATAGEPARHRVRTLPTTHGVNYELADPAAHPDYISTSELSFTVDAVIGPQRTAVRLTSADIPVLAGSACTGPCNLPLAHTTADMKTANPAHSYLNCAIAGKDATCDLRVLRFAQYGRVESPIAFDWLVVMMDNEELKGTLATTVDKDGRLVYPAKADLGGRMIVTVQLDGQKEPLRLRSRKEPVFRGMMPGWPPRGTTLTLANAPLDYYLESQIDDKTAQPFMTVTANTVHLGEKVSEFYQVRPVIDSIRPADGGGLLISWTETAGKVNGPKIVRYHLYRNTSPGNLEGWKRIATVPVGTHEYLDRETRPGAKVEYVVSHAADYPFGYELEGIFTPPQPPSH